MGRFAVNSSGSDEAHEVSLSEDLPVYAAVYSEPTMESFDSGAVSNVMSPKMVNKLLLRMKPKNGTIKIANCDLENVSRP